MTAASESDEEFMRQAIRLAMRGRGSVEPNPMVGCVIVREGQIVGEGFHQYEWRDHAEIVALKSAGEKARGATLYLNLEPCNHTGKTPPCAPAILAAGIATVVMGAADPNPVAAVASWALLRSSKRGRGRCLAVHERDESVDRWLVAGCGVNGDRRDGESHPNEVIEVPGARDDLGVCVGLP